jgi:hypothetical protein
MAATLTLLLALVLPAQRPDLKSLSELELVALMPGSGELEEEFDPATGRYEFVPVLRELRERIAKGKTLDVECWRTILIEKRFLRWRKDWPVQEPFAVSLHLPALQSCLRVRLVPRVRDWKPARASHWEGMCGLGTKSLWKGDDYQELGTLDLETREIEFDLLPVFDGGTWERGATALVHGLGPIRIDVRPAQFAAGILHRRTCSPPAQEIVRSLRLEVWGNSQRESKVYLVARDANWPSWLACSLEVSYETWPLNTKSNLLLRAGPEGSACELAGIRPDLLRDKDWLRERHLELHGTFEGTLREWDATQYWAGTITVPLADLIRR